MSLFSLNMPTTHPRITITLSRDLHGRISRLAGTTGRSMSQVVRDILELAVPFGRGALTLDSFSPIQREALQKAVQDALEEIAQSLPQSPEIGDVTGADGSGDPRS